MPVIRATRQFIRRDLPGVWSQDVTAELDRVYRAGGSPFGLELTCAAITEYTWRSHTLRDSYTRIGKHYLCSRSIGGERIPIQMHLSEEQKESIAAAAMHPSRLQKWLDRGWEDDWDDYFS